MSNDINILIPDGDSTWALNVVQCLAKQSQITLHALSEKRRTAVKYSKYVSSFRYHGTITSSEEKIQIINDTIEAKHIDVVLPISENAHRFFIENKKYFNHVALPETPSLEAFDIAVNKYKLFRFLSGHDLPAPRSFLINRDTSFESITLDFPVLVKPLMMKGGDGIVKLPTKDALKSYMDKATDLRDFFVQQHVYGYDIDCSVLCLHGDVKVHTVQKGNVRGF